MNAHTESEHRPRCDHRYADGLRRLKTNVVREPATKGGKADDSEEGEGGAPAEKLLEGWGGRGGGGWAGESSCAVCIGRGNSKDGRLTWESNEIANGTKAMMAHVAHRRSSALGSLDGGSLEACRAVESVLARGGGRGGGGRGVAATGACERFDIAFCCHLSLLDSSSKTYSPTRAWQRQHQ